LGVNIIDINAALRYKVKDEQRFDINLLRQYSLKVRISAAQFEVAVTDTDTNTIILYEIYQYEAWENIPQQLYVLQEFWKQHHCINARFWKEVVIVVADENFVIIPAYLYEIETIQAFLRFNTSYKFGTHHLFEQKNAYLNLKCAFYLEEDITSWFRNIYPDNSVRWQHATISFVNRLTTDNFHTQNAVIHLDVYAQMFVLTIFQDNQLLFCNTFRYTDSNTFLYFLLFAIDELGLTTRYSKLILYGNISENSVIYRKIQAYFRYVETAKRPSSLSFSYAFDEIPEQLGYGAF